MSPQTIILSAAMVALTVLNVNALPQGGSTGGGTSPDAVARLYTGGGCTGKSTVFPFGGTNNCISLPAAATSAKIINYEIAGCQADFFPEANCGGGPTGGTYGTLNNCEQNGKPWLSVFIRCP